MELTTSTWAFVVTLTYDDQKLSEGDKSAQTINKYHFKKMIAHLRKLYSFKFLVAGEYGKRNRRAHFHAAILGVGAPPEIPPLRTRVLWEPYWLHGFSYFDECDVKSVEYIAKYLTKGRIKKTDTEAEEEWISYSKIPPLGTDFVLRLADDYVSEGVFPRSFRVNPPGSNSLNRRMQITGLQQNLFLHRIFTQWPQAIDLPKSEWMENATTRYKKWKAQKTFELLGLEQQDELINDGFRLQTAKPELTEKEKQWMDYKNTREYAEWLEEVNKMARAQDAKEVPLP